MTGGGDKGEGGGVKEVDDNITVNGRKQSIKQEEHLKELKSASKREKS